MSQTVSLQSLRTQQAMLTKEIDQLDQEIANATQKLKLQDTSNISDAIANANAKIDQLQQENDNILAEYNKLDAEYKGL